MGEPVRLVLTALDESERPLAAARLRVRLFSPRPGRFFSTDRPLVEGTQLLDFEVPAAGGAVEWEYVFPIRGTYGLEASASDRNGGELTRRFDLTVPESREKLLFLGAFAIALFLFGFAAGRAFTGRRWSASAACSVACFAIAVAGEAPRVGSGLEVGPAEVGRLAAIRWSAEEAFAGKPGGVVASVRIEHLEKGKRVFSLSRVEVAGPLEIGFQFADGAPHRVVVLAEAEGKKMLRAEKLVEVAAPHPPRGALAPPLVFFLGTVALGLAAGRASRSRGKNQARKGETNR